jgi:hypothetical protein
MNIVIGPNASGKTTIINILHQSLTGNLSALANIEFKKIVVGLRSFSESEYLELRIEQFDGMIQACLGDLEVRVQVIPLRLRDELGSEEFYVSPSARRNLQRELFEFKEMIRGIVPAVWLPVSRRLPIMDEEEAERRRLHRRPLESVDECLNGLLDMLRAYRISLDSKMSELRKEFQKHALETILYDKQHDQLRDFSNFTPASDTEKQQLLKAFSDVGFLDSRITKRVEEHFRAADQAAAPRTTVRRGCRCSTTARWRGPAPVAVRRPGGARECERACRPFGGVWAMTPRPLAPQPQTKF